MKKLYAFLITGVMVFGLTACGDAADDIPVVPDDDDIVTEEDYGDDYDDSEIVDDEDYESNDGPTTFPIEEYSTDSPAMDYFIGYWEGNSTPPNVWYMFTGDGTVYCNRDNGYLERGTYVVHDAGFAYITYDNGFEEELFSMDSDRIGYEVTDGLSRLSRNDTVEQWILDEFEASEPVYNDDVDNELYEELAGVYEGESSVFVYTFIFYEDGTYELSTDGGYEAVGSFYFDGEKILTTPNGGGEIDEYTFDTDRIIDEYGYEYIWISDPER